MQFDQVLSYVLNTSYKLLGPHIKYTYMAEKGILFFWALSCDAPQVKKIVRIAQTSQQIASKLNLHKAE